MIDPKEVLELCKKATPGWRRGNLASTIVTDAIDENVFGDKANRDFYGGSLVAESIHPANRDFAILARNVLPELAQRVIELEAENARLRETVVEWNEVGEAIMDAVVGRKAPLSDSDVIGEVARLRYENAKLRAVAEAAKNLVGSLDVPEFIDLVPDMKVWPKEIALRIALTAAGYGGEE